jgi:hypothetical protein
MAPGSFGKEIWNVVRSQRTGLLPVLNLYFQTVSSSFLEPYHRGWRDQIEECPRYEGVDLGRVLGFIPGKERKEWIAVLRFPKGLRNWCSMKMHILIGLVLFWCLPAHATTIHAASCSQADVQSAVNSAANGDTVDIPTGGTCAYSSSAVTISGKYITLEGLGITTLTSNNFNIIHVQPTSTGSTRITGFTINEDNGNDSTAAIWVHGSGTTGLDYPFRIDHNTFTVTNNFTEVTVEGNGPGLFDHNTTNQGGSAEFIHNLGLQRYGNCCGWTDDMVPGNANMFFIEDNTFNGIGAPNVSHIVESYYGARTVIRHNTFNQTTVDQHGTCGHVYARWWEIYQNQWVGTAGNLSFYAHLRGGSGVVWGNTATGTFSGAATIEMLEDCGSIQPQSPGGGYEPNGTRVLSPAYVWGNDASIPINSAGGPTLGTDYFVSSNQPATLTRLESAADMTAGSPVSYNYTPYTYPHPLQGASPRPPAPSGLIAVVH